MTNKNKTCSICGAPYKELGNDAEPINKGLCCDSCNQIVIVRRFNDLHRNTKPRPRRNPSLVTE
jgi:hypothetical protein